MAIWDREYEHAANVAAHWAALGNTQAQHDAHKVMQHWVGVRDFWLSQLHQPSPGPGPSYGPPDPPPPPPTPPDPWIRSSDYVEPKGIKQADPDIVLFNDEAVSPELLLQLQYEDVAGMELINISRSDIIDGQSVIYSPVSQLSSLRRKFNPNNIIPFSSGVESFFSRFGIDLGLRGIRSPYFNENGDLVVEIDRVLENEILEVEVDTNGTINITDYS